MLNPLPTTWEEYSLQLGQRLREARLDRGLTQEELAHRAGITRTHYQQVERGAWKQGAVSNPSIRVLARLAQALDVELSELLPSNRDLRWVAE